MISLEYILSAHALFLHSSFRGVFDFYCETINHRHSWHLRCFPQLNTMSFLQGKKEQCKQRLKCVTNLLQGLAGYN